MISYMRSPATTGLTSSRSCTNAGHAPRRNAVRSHMTLSRSARISLSRTGQGPRQATSTTFDRGDEASSPLVQPHEDSLRLSNRQREQLPAITRRASRSRSGLTLLDRSVFPSFRSQARLLRSCPLRRRRRMVRLRTSPRFSRSPRAKRPRCTQASRIKKQRTT